MLAKWKQPTRVSCEANVGTSSLLGTTRRPRRRWRCRLKCFQTDLVLFARNTRLRVIREIIFLILISWPLTTSRFLEGIPLGFKVLVIVSGVLYVLFGVVYYPKARSLAERVGVCVRDDYLKFTGVPGFQAYRCADLSITRVRRKRGNVTEIFLKIHDGKGYRLRNFRNMDELYSLLVDKGVSTQRNGVTH